MRSAIVRAAAAVLVVTGLALAGCAAHQAARRQPAPPPTATGPIPALKVRALGSPASVGSAQPRLQATPDGAILMSWLEPGVNERGARLRLASLTAGRWSAVLTVASGDSLARNWANFPAVAAFGDHGLAVAWLTKVGGDEEASNVKVSLSADGGEHWTRPAVVHDDRERSLHGFVSLVPQGNGVRAVWLDGHNLKEGVHEGEADMTLHTRFVSASGTLAREQEIDERVCDCCQTSAVVSGQDVLVAYRDRSAEEVRDISLARLDGGRWMPPISPRADGWQIHGCPVNGPALATSGERVAIAWFTGAEDQARVFVAFSADGGRAFGAPIRVDDGRAMGRVGVALLDDGTAAVSWLEGGKTDTQVRARLLRDGQRPGASVTVARLASVRGSQVPQLALGGRDLVIAWTDPGRATRVKLATLEMSR